MAAAIGAAFGPGFGDQRWKQSRDEGMRRRLWIVASADSPSGRTGVRRRPIGLLAMMVPQVCSLTPRGKKSIEPAYRMGGK
jgi:hypothetical protein